MENQIAAHCIISGRVQGVFYRAETQRAAQKAGVNGWVRNLADGNVEAFFEGPKDKVDAMVKWCWQGSPGSEVSNVKVDWKDQGQGQKGFCVRY
ncbi:MAG: acylphosphatase [Desulfobacteraceae bacterium]|nr:acylphosphatase [Desulfobacteraceae bacterium]